MRRHSVVACTLMLLVTLLGVMSVAQARRQGGDSNRPKRGSDKRGARGGHMSRRDDSDKYDDRQGSDMQKGRGKGGMHGSDMSRRDGSERDDDRDGGMPGGMHGGERGGHHSGQQGAKDGWRPGGNPGGKEGGWPERRPSAASSPPAEDCLDILQADTCNSYKRTGYCFGDFMTSGQSVQNYWCPRTCGACGELFSPPPSPPAWYVPKAPPVCADHEDTESSCRFWRWLGFCEAMFTSKGMSISKYWCPATCGNCPDAAPPPAPPPSSEDDAPPPHPPSHDIDGVPPYNAQLGFPPPATAPITDRSYYCTRDEEPRTVAWGRVLARYTVTDQGWDFSSVKARCQQYCDESKEPCEGFTVQTTRRCTLYSTVSGFSTILPQKFYDSCKVQMEEVR